MNGSLKKIFAVSGFLLIGYSLAACHNEDKDSTFIDSKMELITEHIKHNIAHAERFYIQYDDYNINRPLNRLIKATLQLLLRKTNDWNNKKAILRLLDVLEPI